MSSTMAEDPVRQDLGRPRGRRRADLHRPAPRPRGHLAAGVRRPAARGPRRCAAPTRRSPPPTTTSPPTAPPAARLIADELSRNQVETLERNCEEFGIPIYSLGSERQGIVHVIGPELGVTQPGMTIVCGDSHTSHPRRLRRARVRHRHLRGRARARDPVPGPEAAEDDADPLLRRARRRRHRQGPDPGDDRPPRHRRHGRPRGRVRRPGDRGALDGGPDDDLQHDDRGRRPRRDDRPRRDHLRVGARAAPAAPEDFDAAVERWRELPTDEGAELRHRGRDRRRRDLADGHLGDDPGHGRRGHRPVPDRRAIEVPADREAAERALAYMALEPGTPMSEIRARPRLHRLLHQLADRGPARGGRRSSRAAGSPTTVAAMVVPGSPAGQGAGRGGGPRRGLPRRRLRLARGRLLDVPGDEPRHPQPRASAAPRPRTATSRAARARAGAPTWSARGWRPRPRSRATSSTSGTGAECRWTRSTSSRAKVSVLDRADVDTDQIIPKQFLKRVERTGFGEFLFYDWLRDGEIELEPNPILVAGRNFGSRLLARARASGRSRTSASRRSSRPSFADIFYANCTKIGLLPVILDEDECRGGRRRRRGADRRRRPDRRLRRRRRRASRSTRRSSTGCCTGSTTSGSRSSARERSTPSRRPARADRGPVTTAL